MIEKVGSSSNNPSDVADGDAMDEEHSADNEDEDDELAFCLESDDGELLLDDDNLY